MSLKIKLNEYKRIYFERRKKTLAVSGISIWFDWMIIVTVCLIFFFYIIFFARNFHNNVQGKIEGAEVNEQVIVRKINEEEIGEVLEALRENRSFSLRQSETATTSPEDRID